MWDWKDILVSSVCAFFVVLWIQNRKRRPCTAHIPGPPGLPIIGNVLMLMNNAKLHRTLHNISKRYKGIFKLDLLVPPPLVVITAPEYLKTFFTNKTHMLDRSTHYRGVADQVPDSVFTANGELWKELRKIMMIEFFNVPVSTWLNNFYINAQVMARDFKKHADGSFFSTDHIIHRRAMDSIMLNCIGEKMPQELMEPTMEAVEITFSGAFHRIYRLDFYFKFIMKLTSAGRKYWKMADYLHEISKQLLIKKKIQYEDMKSKNEPIPNLYIYNMFEKHGQGLEQNGSFHLIHNELKTMVQAGQDTTSATMGFVLTTIGIHPEVQEKIYEEDQKILKSLQGRPLDVEDLRHYDYLERVIKETLRFFPTAPLIGRTVNEDTYFGKYLVPKGAEVVAILFPVMRDPEIFPDPLKFDPDRFLPENAKKIPPFVYNPFSAGPRRCPGQRYAIMSLKVYVSTLVRNYRLISRYTSMEEAIKNSYSEITMMDNYGWSLRLESRDRPKV